MLLLRSAALTTLNLPKSFAPTAHSSDLRNARANLRQVNINIVTRERSCEILNNVFSLADAIVMLLRIANQHKQLCCVSDLKI